MREEITQGYRLSPIQQRLWSLQPDDHWYTYRAQCAVLIDGTIDRALLQAAVQSVVDRHEILRTTFHHSPQAPTPVQVIADIGSAFACVIDLRCLDADAQTQQLAVLGADAGRPFDLERGPLFRTALVILAHDRHALLLGLPALCADALSLGNLATAIGQAYQACLRDEAPLDEPMQFADLAEWQNDLFESEDALIGRAYWRKQDLAALPSMRLPFEQVAGGQPDFAPQRLRTTIDSDSARSIAALAHTHDTSVAVSLLTCWAVVLWRLLGQSDIVVGYTCDGRNYEDLEAAIGPFAKVVPLRCHLAAGARFSTTLGQIAELTRHAYKWQECFTWQDLPEASAAFFPFCFDFKPEHARYVADGSVFSVHDDYACIDQFAIKLSCSQRDQAINLVFHYDPQVYAAADIARLAGYVHTLLAGVIDDAQVEIDALALLNDTEQRQLVLEFNRTAAEFPESCIHQLFAAQAARTPDSTALVYETKDEGRRTNAVGAQYIVPLRSATVQLTYDELNHRANQLAHYLQARGVGPEVVVALCVERSLDLIVGLLGILKAGGAALPLDPAYPTERLAFMLTDSRARVVVTNQSIDDLRFTIDDLGESDRLIVNPKSKIVNLRADWPLIAQASTDEPASGVTPDNLAYLIYTSGSTGRPKGTLLGHRGLTNVIYAQTRFFPVEAASRVLQFAAFSFDAAASEVGTALVTGAALVLAPQAKLMPGPDLYALLNRQRITVVTLPPSALAVLPSANLPALHTLVTAGEACWAALAARWAPDRRFINAYGPTETTIGAVRTVCIADDRPPPIGQPFANVQVYVLDRHMRLVPLGLPGELFIGGLQLARGYLGRPDLTAERFVPNPFAEVSGAGYRVSRAESSDTRYPIPGTRLYRTGDLARYRADGMLEFLGRLDQQVKLRGYRIELGEIEARLSQHPAVRACAVLVRDDTPGQQRLVAYVVPHQGSGIGDQGSGVETTRRVVSTSDLRPLIPELREHLGQILPEYMVPATFVLLDALPLTPSGKLDRAALPAPVAAAASSDYAAPRTPIEELLASIWSAVLGLAQVGTHDNFFALGGHSLLATQVIVRVQETFQIELPVRSLFEAPTPAEFADQIVAAQHAGSSLIALPLEPAPRDGALPLSFAQQRLWFLDQLTPGLPTYTIPTAVQLSGPLALAALHASFAALIQRHEILRTTFVAQAGQPAQIIHSPAPLPLPLLDLQPLAAPVQQRLVQQLLAAAGRQFFDLATGPLLRLTLLRLAPAEHILLLVVHHIVADAWSISVLIREVVAHYAAARAGQPSPLPPLPIQYADFAIWQRTWLAGARLDQQLAYWQRQLGGLPTLELPTDRPRPPLQTSHGATLPIEVPAPLAAALGGLCREHSLTRFMALLTALLLLLQRLSGQDDIAVGTPIANRTHTALEGLIGFFVNTLVLRGDLSGRPSVARLLERVRTVALDAYAHQELPFEQVVDLVQPARDSSRSPLFQVLFALQNVPTPSLTLPELEVRGLAFDSAVAKFDLTLALQESDDALGGVIEYNTDLFDATTILRLRSQFVTLLGGMVAQPAQPISALPLLTAAEQQQLRIEWPAGVALPQAARGLHELFAAQAARTPDAIAVVYETKDEPSRGQGSGIRDQDSRLPTPDPRPLTPDPWYVTYAELNARANQLARHLRERGVGPEMRVGLCLERSLELVIGVFGVLKAGAAYVPLDPAYPTERLAFMIDDAQLTALITHQSIYDLRFTIDDLGEADTPIVNRKSKIVNLDADWPQIARQPTHNLADELSPDQPAYMIYTSGSTGTPKGVLISHGAIVNHMRWMHATFPLTPHDRLLQKTPFSFDASVWEFYAPLLAGAQLVLARPGGQQDSAYLVDTLQRSALTTIQLVPSLLRMLLEQPDFARCTTLTRIFCGGEVLPVELAERCTSVLNVNLYNLYGPTEATIDTAYWRFQPGSAQRSVPLGRAVANTQLYVLDAQMRPVAIGVTGELYIGGAQLARGYFARPDLTAERFVPNPFAEVSGAGYRVSGDAEVAGIGYRVSGGKVPDTRYPTPGTRLYKTGDRVRYRPDGTLDYLGRSDQQIKLRGYRIELGEIAAVLGQHPSVRACVVLVREDGLSDQRLVAYVVSADCTDTIYRVPTTDISNVSFFQELREHLGQTLPTYMIPAAFVLLDALPLLPNGKVDQRALPALDSTSEFARAYVAPRTPTEELLAGIWAHVLGLSQVGVYDNFFALGGHSLLATQVTARLREAFQIELPVRRLFESPTVAELAEAITVARHATLDMIPPLQPAARAGALPLSFAQQRLWFLDQLEPNSPLYTIPAAVRLSGPLDLAVLWRSLNAISARHETLRTTFPSIAGQPAQQIGTPRPLWLPLLDLRALPPPQREITALALAGAEAQRPFDLARGPLLRTVLLRLSDDAHVALLTMHHIISDGWSIGVLIREIVAYYSAGVSGQPDRLPELPIQYADYAIWQRQWLQGAALDAQLAYWQRQLADLPTLELPTDRQRPVIASFRGANQPISVAPALSAGLLALSQRSGVTLFMTMLAAWQAVLARYSDQDDVVVGTPIAGRTHIVQEGLIGFFINTLVLRSNLSGNPSFQELLVRVRETALAAYAHQDLPFEQVVEALAPARDLSRHPLFQVMFALQNAPVATLELPNLTLAPLEQTRNITQFDLSLTLEETPVGLFGMIAYYADLFDAATIMRMASQLLVLLEGIVADPTQRLETLPLLTRAQQHQLLREWNPAASYPSDPPLVAAAVAAQAARTPDAIALVHGDAHLSYQVVNARALQLAQLLIRHGVAPDSVVALALDRSLDLAIALLAVLAAGAAVLPLDPAQPALRLAVLLADAQPTLLLTDSALLPNLPSLPTPSLCLDQQAAAIARQPALPPTTALLPANLAYLLYTSGSTGTPKAVLVEQRQLAQLLQSTRPLLGCQPGDTLPWLAAPTFDIALLELFGPLLGGATLRIVTAAEVLDLAALHQTLAQVTLLHAVPSLLRLLLAPSDQPPIAYPAVRLLLTGGDRVPPDLLAALPQLFPNAVRRVLYGPTEATILTSQALVPAHAPQHDSIGRPLAHLHVHLLDRHGRLVPPGVAGELHIGGAGLSRGYLGRPDLTAARFVPNPWGSGIRYQVSGVTDRAPDTRYPIPDTRLYKTGDRARYTMDGQLRFLGRLDGQVKLRGIRIELGEVMAALRQHPAVRDQVVVTTIDAAGELRLVAYVVPTEDEGRTTNEIVSVETQDIASLPRIAAERDPSSFVLRPSSFVSELRAFLAERLPSYMLPSAFVLLDALPLTPHGKLDRAALPAPDATRPALDSTFATARTAIQETLVGIWAQVLGLNQVGIHDNFFDLGGDSILSIQIIAQARQAGLRLTPKQLFQHQTIADLALVADSAAPVASADAAIVGLVPLTPIQQAFFAADPPEPEHFTQALLLKVRQPLAIAALTNAVRQLLAHHDALRLHFVRTPIGWQQQASQTAQPAISYLDLSALPQPTKTPAVELVATAAQTSLDLANGPLLRVFYIELGADQPARLLLIGHHMVVDGVSWRILLEDLQAAYRQHQQGQPSQLPPKTTAFQRWAQHLATYAQSDSLRAELAYWLAPARRRVGRLPLDDAFGSNTVADAAVVTLALNADETHALLRDLPQVYRTQINDALLAALALVARDWMGTPALLLDLEGHGREDLFADVDLTRTIGWFTTIYPVLLELSAGADAGTALRAVKEQLRAVPQHGIGYGLLRYLSHDAAQLAALPQAELSFNYLGQLDQGLELAGLFAPAPEDSGPARSPRQRREYLIEINAFSAGGQLQVSWTYSARRHSRATIARWADAYMAALRELIAHGHAPDGGDVTPSDFPLAQLSQDELDELLGQVSFNEE